MTGFQSSFGRRDLDRTLGTLLNLEANLEVLTDSIQRQYGYFRGTLVHSHRRMGRGARRCGWGTEVCVWGCGRASHLFNIICPRGQLYEVEGLNR